MNNLNNLVAVNTILSDLLTIHQEFTKKKIDFNENLSWILIKSSFVSIYNMCELQSKIRYLYKINPELSKKFKKSHNNYEFIKYLRNKFIGHIENSLIEKSIEWMPELRYLVLNDKNQNTSFYNVFILQTLINTYVDENGNHKIFSSETDLIYPPDLKRFIGFLEDSISAAIDFLEYASKTLKDLTPKENVPDLSYWLKAGLTDFQKL